MTANTKVEFDRTALDAALARLKLALPLDGSMQPAMTSMGRLLKTSTQLRFRFGRAPDGTSWTPSRRASTQGGKTLVDTARLRGSITYAATRASVAVGTNVVYAAIHQFGGVIRAKKGPFLSIPVTTEARSAGSPRNMTDLHVAQTLKGQYVLVDAKGKVQYLLKASVTIPARPYLGVSQSDSTALLKVLQTHLNGTLAKR